MASHSKQQALQINDKNYKELINNEDFSLVLLLTASNPQIGCVLCTEFMPLYNHFAASYYENLSKQGSDQKVILAVADFIDSRKYFTELQLNNVPKVYYYAPTAAKQMVPNSEFEFVASDPYRQLVTWVVAATKLSPELFKLVEKRDYSNIALNILIVVGALGVMYKGQKKIVKMIYNQRGWQGFSIIFVILFTCGYMFNVIRGTQYIKTNKDGTNEYFIPGHQAQLGVETQIVSAIYGGCTLAFILLTDKLNSMKNKRNKNLVTILMSVIIFLLYSFLVSCFQEKKIGYPFWLLKF
ncbi:hypothetical protein CANARDRAFT_193130 [[Candida] arabinofermentans NRRL YB-2248]|uniref:Magnesium transporter protein 1 n=1 Tax=[Candida] arabinofermentans NRRL YB-2248 TaxID=983967 RepID=A0A1E4T9H8_9ASCO|nr:hypothetical protein CANARDRAFT_193130 [[Candida] arabinofermentans NRRL YB-2248]